MFPHSHSNYKNGKLKNLKSQQDLLESNLLKITLGIH
jgi:hypothetical protein